MKKLIFSIIILLLILAALFWYFFIYVSHNAVTDNSDIKNVTNNDFTLTSEYKGDNLWTYSIEGTLPNPCYKATVDSTVAESYPEQVSVNVKVIKPVSTEICSQVIQNFNSTGSFNASEKATVRLNVQ